MNKVRGERTLTVGTVEYLLRPTHNALATIEGRLDAGLLDVAQRFLKSKPRQTDVAVILNECSRAGGKELPYAQAFDYSLEVPSEANLCAMELILSRFGPPQEGDPGKAEATGS